MKIGDIVITKGWLRVYRRGDKRIIKQLERRPLKCLYLGKTTLQTGTVMDAYSDSPYLHVEQLVPALVLQPLQKTGQRYLKPFHASAEDVNPIEDSK